MVGPEKLPTPRVLLFSEDLHNQKSFLSNILGGDTLQLGTGASSPNRGIPVHKQGLLAIVIGEFDRLRCI